MKRTTKNTVVKDIPFFARRKDHFFSYILLVFVPVALVLIVGKGTFSQLKNSWVYGENTLRGGGINLGTRVQLAHHYAMHSYPVLYKVCHKNAP